MSTLPSLISRRARRPRCVRGVELTRRLNVPLQEVKENDKTSWNADSLLIGARILGKWIRYKSSSSFLKLTGVWFCRGSPPGFRRGWEKWCFPTPESAECLVMKGNEWINIIWWITSRYTFLRAFNNYIDPTMKGVAITHSADAPCVVGNSSKTVIITRY